MNRKGLTRGDGLVVVCVLLVFIFSFLPFYGVPADSPSGRIDYDSGDGPDKDVMFNAWTLGFQPLSAALVLLPLLSLLALLTARFMDNQEHRPMLGLTARQWSIASSVLAAWCAVWSFGADYFGPLFDAAGGFASDDLGLQYGAYVIIPSILVMAFVNAVQDRVAGLAGPLAAAAAPPYPGYGAYSGQYPGAMPPGGSFAGQPHLMAPPPGAAPAVVTPAPASASVPPQAAAGEGGAAFAQFWFAVPEPRDVLPVEGPDSAPVGTLQPGTWYLAVAEHGSGVVAEIDGRHGVLSDLSGIQRGDG